MMMLTTEQYLEAEFDYTLAESRRGFKIHAAVYAIVMTGLIALNALLIAFTDANFPWVIFPFVGWGIGLTFHYIYGFRRAGGEIRTRQAKIEDYAKEPRVTA
jgi:hypothetical protein